MLTKSANFCSLNALEAKLFEFFFFQNYHAEGRYTEQAA